MSDRFITFDKEIKENAKMIYSLWDDLDLQWLKRFEQIPERNNPDDLQMRFILYNLIYDDYYNSSFYYKFLWKDEERNTVDLVSFRE